VYAFIATPVQFWHHHKSPASICISDTKEEKTISKSTGKTVEMNCQICSHHYSVYTGGTPTVFEIAVTVAVANESFSLQSIPAAPFFHFAGRGPPTA
jgi:hypothetical protein